MSIFTTLYVRHKSKDTRDIDQLIIKRTKYKNKKIK